MEPKKPAVIKWYILFSVVSFFVTLLLFIGIIWLIFQDPEISQSSAKDFLMIYFYTIIALYLVFAVVIYILPLFFMKRNSKVGYVWAIVSMALSMTGGITFLPAILLLLQWVKPENKVYFGVK